ncbi:MAG: insulinase family protein [Acidobacteriota bacterium]|nr:insulinase family protein [Acidobacteriota bacterium]
MAHLGERIPSLRVQRVEGAAVVVVRVWLPGGVRSESIPGQALIAGRMLAEGTKRRDWRRISEDAEAIGCSVVTAAGRSVQAVALDGMTAEWPQLLEWAAELVYEGSFPADRCEWLRRQAAAELQSLGDLPEVRTGWAFLEQLYPDHPLGRPIQGSSEGLARLTVGDCRSFHRHCLAAGPLVAVAGDLSPDVVGSRLESLFAANGAKVASDADEVREGLATAPAAPTERYRRIDLAPGDQAHLFVGGLTVGRRHPDFEALLLLGVVLGSGDGLVGRIPQRIREEAGLAYACDVETVAAAGLDIGHFVVSLGTSVDTLDSALVAVRDELERIRLDGPTESDVDEARSYLLGREPFRRETADQWADLLLQGSLLQVPAENQRWVQERLQHVSVSQVREVARRYLDPECQVVTLGVPA